MLSNLFSRLGKVHQIIFPQDRAMTFVMPSTGGRVTNEAMVEESATAIATDVSTTIATEIATQKANEVYDLCALLVIMDDRDDETIMERPYIWIHSETGAARYHYRTGEEVLYYLEMTRDE